MKSVIAEQLRELRLGRTVLLRGTGWEIGAYTVRQAVDAFLGDSDNYHLDKIKPVFERFAAVYGNYNIYWFSARYIFEWVNSQPHWRSESTRQHALAYLERLLDHAETVRFQAEQQWQEVRNG